VIALGLGEVGHLTGGRLVDGATSEAVVTGPVVIDSRRATPGSLFVCVAGEHTDGHHFAAAAAEAGAVAALAARPVGVPAVLVDDPQAALGRLARAVLDRAAGCRVVGVTGSSGKTSTKDLLGRVYEMEGPTIAPENSFNNELGLPLTVLRVDDTTRTLICEYSARGAGHIRYLCGIAPPSTGIVLNVGAAHLGEFGSREAIADAKGEMVEALPAGGTAVLNADDALVLGMRSRTRATIVTFGESAAADVRVLDITADELARPGFVLRTPAGETRVNLQLHGRHHAVNAAAVAAAALADGIALDTVAEGLRSATARSGRRMAVHRRPDGLVVVDDSYNANPESVRAALDALTRIAGEAGRRRWAVLGEMRELGAESAALHAAVGAYAAGAGVDEIVAVGAAAPVAEGASTVAGWTGRARVVADVAAAVALVAGETAAADVVLVKASNSIALWAVADALLAPTGVGASA